MVGFLEQIFSLSNHSAWNISFDIGRWFELNASTKDYETQTVFDNVLSAFYSPTTSDECDFSDLWGSDSHHMTPADNVFGGDQEYELDKPEEQPDPDCKSNQSDDDVEAVLCHRSP